MNAQTANAYIIAQTKENISFLQSTNQISAEDASLILSKLPSELSRNPALRPPPPIPSSFLFRARALWSYNEDGREVNDLKFASGDTIEVIDNANPDWWRGRLLGREGLFPSTYVERLPGPPSSPYSEKPPLPPTFPPGPAYNPPYSYPQYPQQHPQQHPYQGPPQGPPPNGPYPPGPQPPQQGVVVGQDDPKKKKGFFSGSLGNTLAHSAAGGAGFGAGSAVAGGIVNSIF